MSTRDHSSFERRGFILTGIVLVMLAALSYGLSYLHLGRWGIAMALAIAVLKAGTVVAVFMEVRARSASFQLGLLAALFLLATLIGLVATDVAFRRPPLPEPVTTPFAQ